MTKQQRFTQIARQYLGIETLEVRNRDDLDFHNVSVTSVSKALDAAYRAGVNELLPVCEAIDALWRKHGVGDSDAESEPIWNALQRALTIARRDACEKEAELRKSDSDVRRGIHGADYFGEPLFIAFFGDGALYVGIGPKEWTKQVAVIVDAETTTKLRLALNEIYGGDARDVSEQNARKHA